MFENIIGQSVIERLKDDLAAAALPPSLLFCGPEASAKGTAALELARVLCCEAADNIDLNTTAKWSCPCPSCAHHRTLSHPDLLVLGPRPFQAEIAACRAVFLAEPANAAARTLFVRAVRKLLLRFSPVLWEGDPKISKLNKELEVLSDSLEELARCEETPPAKLEKLCGKIVSACAALEAEGVSLSIPVAQIRRGAYWLRLAPNGRRKTLIIENADKMNDAARNSLLKILEEPPETAAIILTSARPKALLATILSRVRPYSFARRAPADEAAVLKRIFRREPPAAPASEAASSKENPILVFQNSFLPASSESLTPAAAYFWSSLAAAAIVESRKRGANAAAQTLVAIGGFCAPRAEAAGFPKHDVSIKALTAALLEAAVQFEPRSLFPLFIGLLYETLGAALADLPAAAAIACRDIFRRHAEEARLAVEIYNQSPALALEHLAVKLRGALSRVIE